MFKLPEQFRAPNYPYCSHGGIFFLPKKGNIRELKVIASDGKDISPTWEHASVTLFLEKKLSKTPNWYEMCYVKGLFWDDSDIVCQYHVSPDKNINVHPGCLHLWRNADVEIVLPPCILV